jgi:hypothetical protein
MGARMPRKPAKERESLADWVMKGSAGMPALGATRPPPPAPPRNSMHLLPEDTHGLPRYIPVTVWIKLLLGEHAPHQNTLLRWVHEGRIQPQPVKTGRFWYVRKDAAYVPD